jgi:serine/threonine-protein kinase HipA
VAAEPIVAEVRLWNRLVGAVAEDSAGAVYFEYDPAFTRSGLEISPRHLPLARLGSMRFPELSRLEAFLGLPGVLADALPDRFGNAVIQEYFTRAGRPDDALSPVQKLLYVGRRAVGALEFLPPVDLGPGAVEALEVGRLVRQARAVVAGRHDVAIPEIMRVGASAGGRRPKALIQWSPGTNEVRSGFAPPEPGYEPWVIKFDGVGEPGAPDPQPQPYNRVELAYNAMAREAGLETTETRLLEERRLAHFLSRRFDLDADGRLHHHTLGGLDHADYNAPGTYSYEQYLQVCRDLGLPPVALEEAFRRAAFNLAAVNQDDHVKNLAFLMNREGGWRLAPAYDLTFARGAGYTRRHQMTLGGKTDDFARDDLLRLGAAIGLRKNGADVLDRVLDAVARWPRFAKQAGVPAALVRKIDAVHRVRALR